MRIAMVGNSHLAAYKLAWENIRAAHPGLDITFFGSPTTSMRALAVENGALVPRTEILRENLAWTSEGSASIAGDFDAYVMIGMGFSFVHLMAILRTHRPASIFRATDAQQLISEDALSSFMTATLGNCTGLSVVDKLRQITHAPIVYAPNPFPATGVLRDPDYEYYSYPETRSAIFAFYRQSRSELVRRGCFVFNQPDETVKDEMFTRDKFTQGAIKLKRGMKSVQKENDYFHMNAEFGRVSMEKLISGYLGG